MAKRDKITLAFCLLVGTIRNPCWAGSASSNCEWRRLPPDAANILHTK